MIFSSIYASSMLLDAIRMEANILKCFSFSLSFQTKYMCSINWKRHFKSITELKMTLNRLCYTDLYIFLYILSFAVAFEKQNETERLKLSNELRDLEFKNKSKKSNDLYYVGRFGEATTNFYFQVEIFFDFSNF